MALKAKIKTAISNDIPGISKNKWNSKMLIVIGANNISAKATHFFNKSIAPTITSKKPTIGKT